jgi:hypothetical protein
MKYNPDTKELHTDKGVLIKKMQCPKVVYWEEMLTGKNDLERICSGCNKSVMDVEFLSDDEVLFLLNKRPDTCIKVNTKKS